MKIKIALKKYMKENNLKVYEVLEKINISRSYLYDILKDKKVPDDVYKKIFKSQELEKYYPIEEFEKISKEFDNMLSVAMMVKNEEINITRCLESLEKINNLKEIIIVDTGSTDKTVEIIKTMNNPKIKLHHKEWNDNFSEMRNYTLSLVTSNWVLIIDADEEISNAEGINLFFKQGCPTEVGILNTINYTLKDLSDYATFPSPRLFKMDKELKYEGAVHNQVKFPDNWDRMVLKSDIKHYGYLNDDQELQKRKFERTSKILKKELEKDPTNHYYLYQLAQSYKMVGKHEEAFGFIQQALEISAINVNYHGVAASLALINKKYEECLDICYDGLKVEPEFIDLWYFMAVALTMLKRYQKAINCFNVFLDLAANYDNLSLKGKTHIVVHTLGKTEDATGRLVTLVAMLAVEKE